MLRTAGHGDACSSSIVNLHRTTGHVQENRSRRAPVFAAEITSCPVLMQRWTHGEERLHARAGPPSAASAQPVASGSGAGRAAGSRRRAEAAGRPASGAATASCINSRPTAINRAARQSGWCCWCPGGDGTSPHLTSNGTGAAVARMLPNWCRGHCGYIYITFEVFRRKHIHTFNKRGPYTLFSQSIIPVCT